MQEVNYNGNTEGQKGSPQHFAKVIYNSDSRAETEKMALSSHFTP